MSSANSSCARNGRYGFALHFRAWGLESRAQVHGTAFVIIATTIRYNCDCAGVLSSLLDRLLVSGLVRKNHPVEDIGEGDVLSMQDFNTRTRHLLLGKQQTKAMELPLQLLHGFGRPLGWAGDLALLLRKHQNPCHAVLEVSLGQLQLCLPRHDGPRATDKIHISFHICKWHVAGFLLTQDTRSLALQYSLLELLGKTHLARLLESVRDALRLLSKALDNNNDSTSWYAHCHKGQHTHTPNHQHLQLKLSSCCYCNWVSQIKVSKTW